MKLYEINQALEACLTIDTETGETTFNEEEYSKLDILRQDKLESIACWVKNITAESTAITNEVKALTERKRAAENKAAKLTSLLEMELAGQKFETARVSVTYRKSTATIIDKEDEIPKEFIRTKIETEPDKYAIKNAINAGTIVPGAHIETKMNMSIK